MADLGPTVTAGVLTHLRGAIAASSVRTEADARAVLREALINELHPEFDRSIKGAAARRQTVGAAGGRRQRHRKDHHGRQAGPVLVADGRRVVLGAADTFRAAAADQLQAWAARVGADVVRAPRAPTRLGGLRRRRQGHRGRRRRRRHRHRRTAAQRPA